ncbi:hypothetical protein [Bradyrhizobium sp.]|uniref:hypothetical protein n=1 Tax=Bradyrhizobium sp. TaxID=376 RepID=UPI00359F2C12
MHVNESSRLATQTITTMAALWKVEEDIRGKDPAARVKARQESPPPLWRGSSICGKRNCRA